MHWLDWLILPIYLIGITLLGVASSRFIRTSSDFFMPRRFGKAMMVTFAFGTGTSSDQAVTVASRTIGDGVSAIWWQWLWLPATPFYWIIAPIMRRLRAITTADAYALRYDRSVGVLFAVVGVLSLAAKIGLLLKGAGAMIDSCTGGTIDSFWAIQIVTVLFVVYGMAGGLGAAIVTDFVQGIMTVIFSFLLLPFVLQMTGGLDGVRATIANYNPQMLALVVPGQIDTFFVVMYALQALVGIVAYPFIMGVCGAGRTELDGRVGFMFGNILKRICTAAWSLTSLAAVAYYLNSGVDLSTVEPDHLYGDMARITLPSVMPGLMGLFLSCLLASIMSSCDAIMISSAALFTENVYKQALPGRSEQHYISVGRWSSVIVVAAGVLFAYWIPTVVDALDFWFKISPTIGLAFWIGLFWRGATPRGAWAGTLSAIAGWFVASRPEVANYLAQFDWCRDQHVVLAKSAGHVMSEPWVILCYMLCGITACVFVSQFTKPTDPEQLQRFYDLTRTPVEPGEIVTTPCTLPEGRTPTPRRMITTACGLEIPWPSATSWWGFVAGWVMVGILVQSFVWIVL